MRHRSVLIAFLAASVLCAFGGAGISQSQTSGTPAIDAAPKTVPSETVQKAFDDIKRNPGHANGIEKTELQKHHDDIETIIDPHCPSGTKDPLCL